MTRKLDPTELQHRAANLVPGLLEHSVTYADAIIKGLEDLELPGGATPSRDAFIIEAFLLTLHMVDRFVFQLIGPERRSIFMDALLTEASTHLAKAGFPSASLEEAYSEKQFQYSQFKELFAEDNAPLKGTLCWEFGKVIATQYGATSPLSIGYLATTAGNNAAFVLEILTTPGVGVLP